MRILRVREPGSFFLFGLVRLFGTIFSRRRRDQSLESATNFGALMLFVASDNVFTRSDCRWGSSIAVDCSAPNWRFARQPLHPLDVSCWSWRR